MKLSVAVVAAVVVFAALGARAAACDGDPNPQNLRATPFVKQGLLRAFREAHPGVRVEGPVLGTTYYGEVWNWDYALSRFEVDGKMTQPALFGRRPGHPWVWSRDTHGGICSDTVPIELLVTWSLQPWQGLRSQGDCYVLPLADA